MSSPPPIITAARECLLRLKADARLAARVSGKLTRADPPIGDFYAAM